MPAQSNGPLGTLTASWREGRGDGGRERKTEGGGENILVFRLGGCSLSPMGPPRRREARVWTSQCICLAFFFMSYNTTLLFCLLTKPDQMSVRTLKCLLILCNHTQTHTHRQHCRYDCKEAGGGAGRGGGASVKNPHNLQTQEWAFVCSELKAANSTRWSNHKDKYFTVKNDFTSQATRKHVCLP